MTVILAELNPAALLFAFGVAAVIAWVIGKRAGILTDGLPPAEMVQAMQFWVTQDSGRLLGPFPAPEVKSMIAAGILSASSELLTAPDAAPVPASAYPWLLAAAEGPQTAPEQPVPAAPMPGLQKAGLIILIVGVVICLIDAALAGAPGLLSLGLLIIGFCLAVVGSCMKSA